MDWSSPTVNEVMRTLFKGMVSDHWWGKAALAYERTSLAPSIFKWVYTGAAFIEKEKTSKTRARVRGL